MTYSIIVRELRLLAGETISSHTDMNEAACAFAMAQAASDYVRIRDDAGRTIADYTRGRGAHWYRPAAASKRRAVLH